MKNQQKAVNEALNEKCMFYDRFKIFANVSFYDFNSYICEKQGKIAFRPLI